MYRSGTNVTINTIMVINQIYFSTATLCFTSSSEQQVTFVTIFMHLHREMWSVRHQNYEVKYPVWRKVLLYTKNNELFSYFQRSCMHRFVYTILLQASKTARCKYSPRGSVLFLFLFDKMYTCLSQLLVFYINTHLS